MLSIYAVVYISLSEIQKVSSYVTEDWIQKHPEEFKSILHSLGADCFNYPVDVQLPKKSTEAEDEFKVSMHRNRFGEMVSCPRYVCNERTDKEWLNSGYASTEAKDKSLRNKLLTDSYRLRGMVEVI